MARSKPYAKVDANLDSHPKIVEAGGVASTVFQFALRINRREQLDGVIPSRFLQPNYVAAQLHWFADPESFPDPMKRVKRGVTRCVSSDLLAEVEGGYLIVGYNDDEWSGVASSTERVRKWRERRSTETGETLPETFCNVKRPDQNRTEQNRTEQSNTVSARKARATPIPPEWAPGSGHASQAAEVGVSLDGEHDRFRDHALATGRTLKDWDAGFRNWLRKAGEFASNGRGAPGRGLSPKDDANRRGVFNSHNMGDLVAEAFAREAEERE